MMDVAGKTLSIGFPARRMAPASPDPGELTARMPRPADPPAAGVAAWLVHIHPPGPALGRRYPLGDAPLTVGRTPDCPVSGSHPSVSRTHARIDLLPGGGYAVTDLGSTNGTFVNGIPAAGTKLADGDYLRTGEVIYRFLAGGNVEAAYHEAVGHMAACDPLTGLPNRRALDEALGRELDRAARHGARAALALLDVDHFKAVNDRLGHPAGDHTLTELGRLLAGLARRHELLARYGGEEFALLLPGADAAEAAGCGERLRRAVEGCRLAFGGRAYRVTVSVGVAAVGPGERLTAADLIGRADARLYEAKRGGRNRVCGGHLGE